MVLDNKKKSALSKLVGEFESDQLRNLLQNIDCYIHPEVSMFVPLFRFCDYAVSPNHRHPAYSFIYNIKTKGRMLVNNTEIKSPKGLESNICIFSPEVKHQEIIEDGFSSYIAVFIRKETFEKAYIEQNKSLPPVFKGNFLNPDEDLLFLLKLFMNEERQLGKVNNSVVNALISLICHKLVRIVSGSLQSASVNSQNQIDKVINYMYENLENKIAVEELATLVNMSVSNFSKIFKQVSHKTPIEYLTEIRIEKAKRLLRAAELNLTEIAFACGFSSSSYFTHTFIDVVKLKPSEYRRKLLS